MITKVHELNQKGIENDEHSRKVKQSYHNQAIRLAKKIKKEQGASDVLYYELAHSYAHKMLLGRSLPTKVLPMLKMLYYNHQSLRLNDNNDESLYLAGAIADFFKKARTARAYYRKAFTRNPGNLIAAIALVKSLRETGADKRAIEVIRLALKQPVSSRSDRRRQIELASLYMRIDSKVVFTFNRLSEGG